MTNSFHAKAPNGTPQALANLRVLDLGHILTMGIASSMLADFGAQVIKVEQPGEGDGMRKLGPKKDGQPLWWKVNARNKKSVTLDLKKPEGKRLCLELVRRSDVVLENFRPGTLERLGLGWKTLAAENPRLIMLRVSGYGQTGPHRGRSGFGRAAEAMSGAAYLSGFADGPPVASGFSLGDTSSGLMAAFAVMVALYHRDQPGGKGQCIDLGLYESIFRLIDWQVIVYDQLGIVPQRAGNRFPLNLTEIANLYESRDGCWIAISAVTQSVAQSVMRLVGGEALCADPRFATREVRLQNADALDSLIKQWFSQHPREYILAKFEECGAVACPVYNVKDMLEDRHFTERGNVIQIDDQHLGPVRMVGTVPTFSETPGMVTRTGPTLGQDNEDVFVDMLGMPRDEFNALKAAGVI